MAQLGDELDKLTEAAADMNKSILREARKK